MNLVQIAERLKDLPASIVKQYADGKNPAEVPPYLAAAELARKVRMEQRAAQAPQKTVKEQLEEKLGLGALPQAMPKMPQEAQGISLMPQGMPQTPPPEQPQEEAPQPAMAASGGYLQGIAKIPVNMFKQSSYAGGGIVAFDDGGDVESEIERLKAKYAASKEDKREAMRAEGRTQDPYDPSVLTSGPRVKAFEKSLEEFTTERPAEEQMLERANLARRQMEIDRQLRKEAGIEDIGIGALKRAEERERQYEAEKERRANENFIARLSKLSMPNMYGRVLGGEYGTMYAQQAAENRASDMAFRDAQDKLKDAIEEKRRADAVGNLTASKEASQAILSANRELAKLRVTGAQELAKAETSGIPQLIQARETERYHRADIAQKEAYNAMYERLQKEHIGVQRAQLLASEAARRPEVIRTAEELAKKPEFADKKFSELLDIALRTTPAFASNLERLEQLRAANIEKAIKDANTQILLAQTALKNAKTPEEKQTAQTNLEKIYTDIYARYPAVGGIAGLNAGNVPTTPPSTEPRPGFGKAVEKKP